MSKLSWDGERRTQYLINVALLILLILAVVQVQWWLIDQRAHSEESMAALEQVYREQADSVNQQLKDGLLTETQVEARFSGLEVMDGVVRVKRSALFEIAESHEGQVNQFAYEGGFFVLVLLGAIGVLIKALRTEQTIRNSQDMFLSAVSHEFRTPLASLRLALETLVMRHAKAPEEQKLAHRMDVDLLRMERLVGNVLDASRLAGGQFDLTEESLHVGTIISDAIDKAATVQQMSTIKFSTDVDEDLFAVADSLALNIVVSNVIANAVVAVQEADRKLIEVQCEQEKSDVVIRVTDTGIGFDPSESENIFGKFHQAPGAMRKRGTGLGLYIARRLINLCGGEISGTSEGQGRGATFTIRCPADSASSATTNVESVGAHAG